MGRKSDPHPRLSTILRLRIANRALEADLAALKADCKHEPYEHLRQYQVTIERLNADLAEARNLRGADNDKHLKAILKAESEAARLREELLAESKRACDHCGDYQAHLSPPAPAKGKRRSKGAD
jgi:hypothetical protein